VSDRQETYIYESPDGGHTVYRRQVGSPPGEREIHSISDEKQNLMSQMKQDKLWGEIRRSAKDDPILQDLLDQVEVYYRLKSQP
jgi:hypothetical protein